MKVKVIKPFIDKHTGEIYKENQVLEITKTRAKEILSVGNYIEEIIETNEEKKTQKVKK